MKVSGKMKTDILGDSILGYVFLGMDEWEGFRLVRLMVTASAREQPCRGVRHTWFGEGGTYYGCHGEDRWG